MSIRLTPSSTARRSTASAASRSGGGPQMPSPVTRIAPKPSRRTVRSPSSIVPADSSSIALVASVAIRSEATLPGMPPLLAVPNVSQGSDRALLGELQAAFGRGAAILDRHTDADHDRTVFTLAEAEGGGLLEPLLAGAAEAVERIDMSSYAGAHPAIGSLDVCPVVWIDPGDRERARAEAVAAAAQIGGLGVPVFLYGELARSPGRAERAYFRSGGLTELWLRMEGGELRPDFGPQLPHPRGGATLVTARPPLAAFNVELDSGDVELARAVAAGLREAGGGLPGVRAIGAAALQRPCPGLDQRPRPAGGAAGRGRRPGRRAGGAARSPAAGRRAGRPGAGSGARRIPGGGADARLRPRAPRDRAAPRRGRRDHLDSGHGSDEEEATAQAPWHPGRADRLQAPRRPSPQPRRGEIPRLPETRPAERNRTCRRPGAARSSAA